MITAPAVLQLVEQGLVKLTDPINLHIDPILLQLNGTRLEDHFGSPIRDVEIQHLLHMTSGIQDYDGEAFSAAQFANRSKAFGPVENLEPVRKPHPSISAGRAPELLQHQLYSFGLRPCHAPSSSGHCVELAGLRSSKRGPHRLAEGFHPVPVREARPLQPVHACAWLHGILSERTASEAGRLERQLLGRLDSGGLRWFRCRHCSFYIRPVQHQGPQDCHGAVASAFDKLHRSRNEWHAGSHHSCTACRRFKLSRSTSLFLSLSLSLLSLSLSLSLSLLLKF